MNFIVSSPKENFWIQDSILWNRACSSPSLSSSTQMGHFYASIPTESGISLTAWYIANWHSLWALLTQHEQTNDLLSPGHLSFTPWADLCTFPLLPRVFNEVSGLVESSFPDVAHSRLLHSFLLPLPEVQASLPFAVLFQCLSPLHARPPTVSYLFSKYTAANAFTPPGKTLQWLSTLHSVKTSTSPGISHLQFVCSPVCLIFLFTTAKLDYVVFRQAQVFSATGSKLVKFFFSRALLPSPKAHLLSKTIRSLPPPSYPTWYKSSSPAHSGEALSLAELTKHLVVLYGCDHWTLHCGYLSLALRSVSSL